MPVIRIEIPEGAEMDRAAASMVTRIGDIATRRNPILADVWAALKPHAAAKIEDEFRAARQRTERKGRR